MPNSGTLVASSCVYCLLKQGPGRPHQLGTAAKSQSHSTRFQHKNGATEPLAQHVFSTQRSDSVCAENGAQQHPRHHQHHPQHRTAGLGQEALCGGNRATPAARVFSTKQPDSFCPETGLSSPSINSITQQLHLQPLVSQQDSHTAGDLNGCSRSYPTRKCVEFQAAVFLEVTCSSWGLKIGTSHVANV